MTNWDDEFSTPTPAPAENTFADFDAADDMADFHAEDFAPPEPERPEDDSSTLAPPFDIRGIDLLSPPGFVGDVAAWIDSQCRYPRRRLAVASAIVSVGNIGGLSHQDTYQDATANMLAFCVAASATGKEAVQQATAELHRATGLHRAMVGAIKSTKEILENLIEHQPSYFVIDEFGIFLTKVKNAQTRGGASHLEDVNGTIMSAYSKANGYLPLGGREKRELRKQFATAVFKAREDGKENEHAEKMLKMIDNGLDRPFLSLVGYTTPVTFEGVMDGRSATEGFIGRAILVQERDINPMPRADFVKKEMPPGLRMRLMQLYSAGSFSTDDTENDRIEFYGERVAVETTPEAKVMLNDALKWFLEYAEDRKHDVGEAAVAMARRSFELVSKISFILALAARQRTEEHVRWAYAYIRQELNAKIALVFANDNQKDKSIPVLAARIQGYIDPEKGTSASVIANRMKMTVADVENALEQMSTAGIVYSEIGKRKYKGKPVTVWRMRE